MATKTKKSSSTNKRNKKRATTNSPYRGAERLEVPQPHGLLQPQRQPRDRGRVGAQGRQRRRGVRDPSGGGGGGGGRRRTKSCCGASSLLLGVGDAHQEVAGADAERGQRRRGRADEGRAIAKEGPRRRRRAASGLRRDGGAEVLQRGVGRELRGEGGCLKREARG